MDDILHEKEFFGHIEQDQNNLYSFQILVPEEILQYYKSNGIDRIMVSVDSNEAFHAGFIAKGSGIYFIKLNKKLLKSLGQKVGNEVAVRCYEDTSKYGITCPEEFEEVLIHDPEGSQWFEGLTPGKKRSLIFVVSSVKSSNKRIEKALIILDHLKLNDGKLNWKLLHEAFKQ